MADQQSEPTVRKVRPTVMVGGGSGDTTFVDLHDLHPVNETTAAISGGAGGAVLGAGAPALVLLALEKDLSHHKGKLAFLAVVGATLGATISHMNAKTHNQWSDRVTSKTLEAQNQGPQVG